MRNWIRVVLLLVALPASAQAWGGDGHRIVCGIAWQRLTPDGLGLAARLLGATDEKTFVDACVWADEVRNDRPDTYNYHFINIPAGAAGMDMQRDCAAPKRCASWAIVHFGRVLADPKADALARTEALKWVLHFVGDLHQPLHAGRPDDLGGNRIFVDFFGDAGNAERRNNLHSVWDSQILRRAGLTWPDASNVLAKRIVADEAKDWETLDVTVWTNESFRVAEDYVYGKLRADNRIRNFYYQPALGYIEAQMMKAGVRMAHLINSAAAGDVNTLR